MSIPWLRRSWVLVCAHRDPIRVFLILTARLALPPPSLNFNFRPPSSALRFLRLLRVFAAILPNSVLRLLLPLCQRSVVSVTKSDSDFRAFCASSRPTFQTFSPRITRIARIKKQPPFSLFPPVKSVLCTLSSVVCPPSSVLRRPSPASSVSELRGLCDTIRLRFCAFCAFLRPSFRAPFSPFPPVQILPCVPCVPWANAPSSALRFLRLLRFFAANSSLRPPPLRIFISI
jgi:hypothetical protein